MLFNQQDLFLYFRCADILEKAAELNEGKPHLPVTRKAQKFRKAEKCEKAQIPIEQTKQPLPSAAETQLEPPKHMGSGKTCTNLNAAEIKIIQEKVIKVINKARAKKLGNTKINVLISTPSSRVEIRNPQNDF